MCVCLGRVKTGKLKSRCLASSLRKLHLGDEGSFGMLNHCL